MLMCACVHVGMHGSQRSSSGVFLSFQTGSPECEETSILLGWLASELRGYTVSASPVLEL